MILMWLGSFVLMLWGLTSFQKNVAASFADLQKSILSKGLGSSQGAHFLRGMALVITEASPMRALYSAVAHLNLRILPTRPAVLLMCLSPLGLLPVLFLGALFLNLSGFFILGLCVVTLLRFGKANYLDDALKALFSVGVFLVGAESIMRNSSVVQTYLTQNDLVFFLADGRFGAVLVLIFASFFLSLFVQTEFWSLAFALSLLATGTISFNGALGLVLGERLAMAVVFWFRMRKLNQECRHLGQQYAVLTFLSSLMGFWFAGELRVWMGVGYSTDLSAMQEKTFSFLLLFAVMLGIQWIGGMIWGHFAGSYRADEIQDAKYFSSAWLDRSLISEGQRSWAKEKVHKRLSEIRYHLAGLQTMKDGQVPEQIQARIKDEEKQLSALGL